MQSTGTPAATLGHSDRRAQRISPAAPSEFRVQALESRIIRAFLTAWRYLDDGGAITSRVAESRSGTSEYFHVPLRLQANNALDDEEATLVILSVLTEIGLVSRSEAVHRYSSNEYTVGYRRISPEVNRGPNETQSAHRVV